MAPSSSLLLLFALGCGGREPRRPDADADAGTDAAPGYDPTPPAPPQTTPCPDGWRVVPDAEFAEVVVCDPWPEGGRSACAADEAQFPGDPACARIGAACPAGDFPDDLPAGAIHVLDGAAAGGDGTPASPFATIAEATAVAADGDTIGLSQGTFTELVAIPSGVTLRGACVGGTEIASPGTGATATVTIGEGGRIQDVSISGDRLGIDTVAGPRTTSVEAVVVHEASAAAISVVGAALTLTDVVVRATLQVGGRAGQGLEAYGGARIEMDRVSFEGNHYVGILVGDAEVVATDLVVADTEPSADGLNGYGIQATSGAVVTLAESVLEDNQGVAVIAVELGTTVTASDLAIRGVRAGPDGMGFGVEAQLQSTIEIARGTLEGAVGTAAFVTGAGTRVHLADTVVQGTSAAADGVYGAGLDVTGDATLELERVAVLRSTTVGLAAFGAATSVVASDLLVAETHSRPSNATAGTGVQVDEAALTVERGALRANRAAGLYILRGARATLTEVAIDDTVPAGCAPDCADGGFGSGVIVDGAAELVATGFRIADNALCGVQIGFGEVDLHTGEISGNAIGANLQDARFDARRLQDDVVYRDNGANLDSQALPSPEPMTEL